MSTATAYLRKRPRPRAEQGHPWVYAGEIARWEGEPVVDGAVHVRCAAGRFLGSALFSPESSIRLRIFSHEKSAWGRDVLREKIASAIDRRNFARDDSGRLVWSEADGLPGLTVDVYGGGVVVFQIQHVAIDYYREDVVLILTELLQPSILVERSDGAGRKMEGLAVRCVIVRGTSDVVESRIGNARFLVNLLSGQKSGAFLDQAENYKRVAAHCRGKSVLDCFCHHGGFAIHAAMAGAKRVLAVDISEDAVAGAKQAAELNGVVLETHTANVFDDLREREKSQEKWDVVILDPPSFTRSRSTVEGALRGYREINLRAFKLLESDGILATYSCSHHIQPEDFLEMLRGAARDARRDAIIIEDHFQSSDHPVLLGMPESRYLHGWLLRVV